ncbi:MULTISPECIES: LysR family transcriptional regulator [unclassified Frankia]|uniref:LysR family transcriptional regulator n=1 Tax=unclassified Frankia TaxID=2632575 RepID=UPI002AD4CA36|nr:MULTISPECIES: LysR family transcriptional regulator [unclassified Frankia]
MRVVQLRCFVAVAQELSYRRAAASLQYSASHVSQQIRQLENELAVTLFDRSTHHVTLTPAGRRLLPEARDLLAAHGRVRDVARGEASGRAGFLRISYSSGSGEVMARAVRAFVARYPDVDIVPSQVNNQRLADDMRDRNTHVSFSLSTSELAVGLSCLVLHDFAQNHLALPTDHPLQARGRLTVHDLQQQRLLVPSAETDRTHGQRILDFLNRRGVTTDYRSYPIASEEEVVDLVSAGLGVAFVGEATRRRWGGWPHIVIRRLDGEVPHLFQLMIWQDTRQTSLTRAFVEIAQAEFDARPLGP